MCEFDLHLRNGAKWSKLNWTRTGRGEMMARKLTTRGPQWLSLDFHMEFDRIISECVTAGVFYYV